MIKNFFVKTQTIKGKRQGLTNYINYLRNNEHKNHIGKTEKIIPIWDKDYFIEDTFKSILEKEITTKMIGKGGSSFQSYRQSFCLSFPTDVEQEILTTEVLTVIYKKVIEEIFRKMEIPRTAENLKKVFGNVHFNNNVHINIVIPKVINNKTFDFSKKSIMELVKKTFDNECINIGLDKKDYQKVKTFEGRTKTKSLEQYKDSQERKKIYLESRSRLIEVKQFKDNMINIKTDDKNFIEFKKMFYSVVNRFIKDFTTISTEKKKEKKTVDIYEVKERYEEVLPNLLEINKKGVGMLETYEKYKKNNPEMFRELVKQYKKEEENKKTNIDTKNPIKTTENIKEVEIPKKVVKSYYEGFKSLLSL